MYTPPASTAVNFNITSTGYTAPASTAVNFNFPPSGGSGGGGTTIRPTGIVLLIGL